MIIHPKHFHPHLLHYPMQYHLSVQSGLTIAMVTPDDAVCSLEGGLKSNFAGIRWMGGSAKFVVFFVELHAVKKTAIVIVAQSNRVFFVINFSFLVN